MRSDRLPTNVGHHRRDLRRDADLLDHDGGDEVTVTPRRIPYRRILAECLHLAAGGEVGAALLHWRECVRAERVARGRF